MPARFVKVDLVDRLSPHLPKVASQAVIALVCTMLALVSRAAIDFLLPSAGPFALTFPFVLLATLFGRWEAGAGVMCLCALHAWYFVLPVQGSFAFENATDGPRVVVNVFSGFLIVGLAEYFRRVVRSALQERDAIARDRMLLLEELDHRVKNNFAMVSGMIRMELRTAHDDSAIALQTILGRVESIARAHEALYRGVGGAGVVKMRPYLNNLCDTLDRALFGGDGTISSEACDIVLLRDQAIAIGLVVNELCTNAMKHAFEEGQTRKIEVNLVASETDIVVAVADNGVGLSHETVRDGALGRGLVEAFAIQAGGKLEEVSDKSGTTFQLVLPVNDAMRVAV